MGEEHKLSAEDFTFKTKPLKHQLEALIQSATKRNFAYLMEMGCVDGETEFLSNRGWVKFKDLDLNTWERPLLVGQVMPPAEGVVMNDESCHSFAFVPPITYTKKLVKEMIHFEGTVPGNTTPCLDIMVTPDHRMAGRLVYDDTVVQHIADEVTAQDMKEHILKRAEYSKPFTYKKERGEVLQRCTISDGVLGYDLQPSPLAKLNVWQMRVMVAIIADGNFPYKNSNRCVMEFSKERKIKRFEMLCRKAGIVAVKESIRGGASTRFNLIAPARKKIFDEDFWTLPPTLHHAIFSEVFFWDGSEAENRNRFYTIHKQSADFVQFLGVTHGYRTALMEGISNKAPYYTVSLNPQAHISSEKYNPYTTITKQETIAEEQYAYCFRVPSGELLLRRNNKVFVTGNSGKTKVIIDNMAFLKKKNAIQAALIMAPKGVYRNWSTQEIPKHMPDDVNAEVLVWKAEGSMKYKRELAEQIRAYDGSTFPILVFNIESLLSDSGEQMIKLFMQKHKGAVMGIIDESTCIKNHKAVRTRKALKIGAECRVKRIATGSPITNSPLDLFSQFAFLDKQILGCGSYWAFRNIYAETEQVTTRQGQSFTKIVKYKNLPMLTNRIKDFSFRVTKKECLDLPNKIYITRDVELSPEQKKLYREMKNLSFTVLGEDIMSVQVALTKLLRLHQILCGSFTTDEGETKSIPNNRLKALEEILDETSGKVIIWANYLQNIEDIKDLIIKKYGPESIVVYTGATTNDSRVEAIKLFQNANSPVRFFLGNVQTAGRGITLTAANTVIYYSNNYSLEMRQQSEDRAHRVGQVNPVTYIDLVAKDTLDEKIIQALLAKRNIANEILHDDLENWISL